MTYCTAGRVMSTSAPTEAVQVKARSSQHFHRRSALSEIAFIPDSVLTPESSQQQDEHYDCGTTFTSTKERKRFRDDKDAMDIDDGISRIRMKPDILTFYRTPGAFKFCRRVSSGPPIDHFHTSNRGSPLPDNILIEILSFLNKRDLCNAMATCRLLYGAGSRCRTWEYMDLFNRTVFNHSLVCFLNRRLKVMRMADTNGHTSQFCTHRASATLRYRMLN
ncbi:F-box domain-containing protein [Trichostrongylus colubriformis]|uniref:F-box domain-containing protein n=1 Tax=Trichostrongylus colubriformis TaxID=6319 RepID=A0AAN8F4X2_TRICO